MFMIHPLHVFCIFLIKLIMASYCHLLLSVVFRNRTTMFILGQALYLSNNIYFQYIFVICVLEDY